MQQIFSAIQRLEPPFFLLLGRARGERPAPFENKKRPLQAYQAATALPEQKGYPLTEPAVMPSMMKRCASRYNSSSGKIAKQEPVIIRS